MQILLITASASAFSSPNCHINSKKFAHTFEGGRSHLLLAIWWPRSLDDSQPPDCVVRPLRLVVGCADKEWGVNFFLPRLKEIKVVKWL
jgi:hypothetical protein